MLSATKKADSKIFRVTSARTVRTSEEKAKKKKKIVRRVFPVAFPFGGPSSNQVRSFLGDVEDICSDEFFNRQKSSPVVPLEKNFDPGKAALVKKGAVLCDRYVLEGSSVTLCLL